MGWRNSIKTRIYAKNEAVYIMGCPCHIVHNTADKAADSFESVTGFDVDTGSTKAPRESPICLNIMTSATPLTET